MMYRKYHLLLIILIFSFVIRFWQLDSVPSSALYGDELTESYDSYSILKTGYSQTGDFLPWTFKMAEGRPPGYVYFSIPFTALFGPSALGIRLLSVFSGIGIVILMFFLGRLLVNEKVGYIAALLTSISPWAIHISRGGFETNFALFLTLLGVVTFLQSKTKTWLLIISAVSFFIAIHTYPTYKLTVPLLVGLLILYSKAYLWLNNKKIRILAFVFSALIIGAIAIVFTQAVFFGSEGRIANINIFNQDKLREDITQKINYETTLDKLNLNFIKKLLHNKPLEYSFVVGENYLQSFSVNFLFLHGDTNPRHNPATMGELYLIEFITIILGLFYFFKTKNNCLKFIIPWLFIAPIPASIISEPHALRDTLMLPPLLLLSATGLIYLWNLFKAKRFLMWLNIAVPLIILIQFIFFMDRYFFIAPSEFSRFWSYPAKLASDIVTENKDKYKYIILSDSLDSIEFAYPVYAKVDPKLVIDQNKQKTTLKQYQFKNFGNIYIGHIPDGEIEGFINSLPGSVMYIGTISEEKSLTSFDIVNGLDTLPAFIIKKKF